MLGLYLGLTMYSSVYGGFAAAYGEYLFVNNNNDYLEINSGGDFLTT
jgi:hypothetical protein